MDVLITGASGVIGNSLARHLAAEGFRPHLTSRFPERLRALTRDLSASSAPAAAYSLDLQDLVQCRRVIETFLREAAHPYGLICNAGDLGELGPFLKLDFNQWMESFQRNFLGHAAMIHAFVAGFYEKGLKGGRIVALSGAGLGGNSLFANVTSYSTAKAALTHLTEALAPELEPLNMTINAIAPGAVLSGFTEQAIQAGEERIGDYATKARQCKETGGVSPELTAELVAFLMGPLGGKITGRLLSARFDRERLRRDAHRIAENPNLYRLRRIDEELFSPGPGGKSA